MGLAQDVPDLVKEIKEASSYLKHQDVLLDIFEGNLKQYIEADLAKDFSPESFQQVMTRIAPINVLTRVVDKLSKIYSQPPARSVKSRKKRADGDLLQWYLDSFKANRVLNQGNEFFNLSKSCLLQPYVSRGKPKLRVIPNGKFYLRSTDREDPTRPTQIVTLAGTKKSLSGEEVSIFYGYSDEEFVIFNSKNEIETGMMADIGADGTNVYGRLPFVYVNRSLNCIRPQPDSDVLAMTKLLPILLSDLGYAIKFQAFSIIYGIDLDEESLVKSPSAFWRLKSDAKSENTPSIGSIKPDVDITEVQGFIQFLLGMWLQSKNIRPGAVGDASPENFASGISKMVDEMDTSEDRSRQVEYFKPAEEEDLWPLIMNHMHPFWAQNGLVENSALFSPEAMVEVNFAEQLPLVRRGQMVNDLKVEVEAGFLKRRDAIAKLNPQWSEEEVDAYALEVQEEKKQNAADFAEPGEEGEEKKEGGEEEEKDAA